jgi:vacuolar-type H+-ATPase subunit F/Vma7
MNGIVVITPVDAGNGFACCGALQYSVSPGRAAETLTQVLADGESRVVILDERLVAEIGEERLGEIERLWPGVLVVLPAPGAAPAEEDYAVRLIRRAIGYHVRVRM